MNAFIRDQLSRLDRDIEKILLDFDEIKDKMTYKRYAMVYQPYEKQLRCKTSFDPQCICFTEGCSRKTDINDLVDLCRHVIDTFYESQKPVE